MRIVVGSATGGGYDVYSRLIAPYLGKGAGSDGDRREPARRRRPYLAEQLYATAPDGLIMSFANGTAAAFAQLTEQQGMRFDLAKFDYLATVGRASRAVAGRTELADQDRRAGGQRPR